VTKSAHGIKCWWLGIVDQCSLELEIGLFIKCFLTVVVIFIIQSLRSYWIFMYLDFSGKPFAKDYDFNGLSHWHTHQLKYTRDSLLDGNESTCVCSFRISFLSGSIKLILHLRGSGASKMTFS
jgi:hypothetical protein